MPDLEDRSQYYNDGQTRSLIFISLKQSSSVFKWRVNSAKKISLKKTENSILCSEVKYVGTYTHNINDRRGIYLFNISSVLQYVVKFRYKILKFEELREIFTVA